MRYRFIGLLPLLFVVGCGGSGSSSVTAARAVYTIAGSELSGLQNGSGSAAQFSNPANLAVAGDGTVYVCDYDNDAIRKITSGGIVSTLTKQPLFQKPFGIALSSSGKLYVGTDDDDAGTHSPTAGTVWQINTSTGVPTVLARDIGRPRGLGVMSNGMVVVSNISQSVVQILNPVTGTVSPLAGQLGVAGYAEGHGVAAMFDRPYGVAVQSDDSILVADQANNRIRKITLAGDVTTYVGTGAASSIDGPIATSTVNGPQGVQIDGSGNVYVIDTNGKVIREISGGKVATIAGNGIAGFKDGAPLQAEFFGLEGFFVTSGGLIYIADGNGGDDTKPYDRVRVIR